MKLGVGKEYLLVGSSVAQEHPFILISTYTSSSVWGKCAANSPGVMEAGPLVYRHWCTSNESIILSASCLRGILSAGLSMCRVRLFKDWKCQLPSHRVHACLPNRGFEFIPVQAHLLFWWIKVTCYQPSLHFHFLNVLHEFNKWMCANTP